jgi:predicted phage terminase large subunit-like protein
MGMKYLLDVYYTTEPNEITETEVAKRFLKYNVNHAKIESNAGGRAFCRNVERISRELGNVKTKFQPFHQSGNKVARIINNASTVQNAVMFPNDWAYRWEKFYNSMTSFMSTSCQDTEGHDDAADTITGVVESNSKPLKAKRK